MVSIEAETRAIFALGGPLHQVMQQCQPGAPHRRAQEEAAIDYAAQLDRAMLTKPASDNSKRPQVAPLVRQIAPGVGKTLSYLVPLILSHHLTGRRGLISTYTTELRNDLPLAAQIASEAVSLHFQKPIHPKVVVRESITSRASIVVAAMYLRDMNAKGLPSQRQLAQEYFDWIVEKLLLGELPQLNDWINIYRVLPGNAEDYSVTLSEQRGSLPSGIAGIIQPLLDDYCARNGVGPFDAASITKDGAEAFKATNSRDGNVGQADILIVTHAMFLMNNAHFGDVLHTSHREDDQETTGGFNVVLDEAEMLSNQAAEWTKFQITLEQIEDSLAALQSHVPKEVVIAHQNLDDLIKIVRDYHFNPRRAGMSSPQKKPRAAEIWEDDEPRQRLAEALMILHHGISAAYNLCAYDLDLVDFQHTNRVLNTLIQINEVIDHATGSQTQSSLIKGTKTKPITEINMDQGDVFEMKISTEPLHNNYLASWAWRNVVQHVHHVYALSATLVGGDVSDVKNKSPADAYQLFMNRIGIDKKTAVCLPALAAASHGGLSRLVLTAATVNRDKDTTVYAEHVVNSLLLAFETPMGETSPSRTLVLFPSAELREATRAALLVKRPDLTNHIYYGKVTAKLPDFAADPQGIWFGHNWQGTNFVDKNGNTLIGRIIVAKAPVTPVSLVKSKYMNKSHSEDNMDDAAMKIIQGAGRGMRKGSDRPELWLLDPFIFHTRVQKKFGGKGGTIGSWVTLLDGFPIHWARRCPIAAIDSSYRLVPV